MIGTYKKLFLLCAMIIPRFACCCMDKQTQPLPSASYSVVVQNDKWYITVPQLRDSMVFSHQQINEIVFFLMNQDQRAIVLNGSSADSSIDHLIDFIMERGITPTSLHSASSELHHESAVQKQDFTVVMDRLRMLARGMSQGRAIPIITIDRKLVEYRAMQMRGDVIGLNSAKEKIQQETRKPLRKTIWRGWTKQMEHRVRLIDRLLSQEITKKLNVIRTGRLSDAEAVVAELAAQWPYRDRTITTTDEARQIKEYVSQVGFNELQAARDLIALRPDYYRELADRIYNGEPVTQREYQLARKALHQPHYKQMVQQRELRIEHLKANPDQLPLYKEFLVKHPGELRYIPIEGKILSVEEFKQWCDQKTITPSSTELAHQQELAEQQEAAQRQQEQEIQQRGAESIFRSILPQGMQHEIIDTLGKSRSHEAVAQQLDTKIQEVLRQAQEHNVLIHPELDWRLQAALKALPQSVNAKDFTFHLATVEHLVNDIQSQAVPEQMSLIDRSPELLAQAVNKYFEYLSPTKTEIALIVDMARYVSDVTTGSEYLSAEAREQRIAQFWQAIDSLKFDNLSKLTAEQVIDSAAYIAARATYVMGARAAIAVVNNLKYVSAAVPRTAALFAQRFVKVFDSVIGANPVLITNEGAFVWNASSEAAAEARQLVHAFDGMKDKPAGKPPEILDDTQKVVENESKLGTKTVGDVLKESSFREQKRKATLFENPKGTSEAMRNFESLGLSDTEAIPHGKQGKLPDGRMVNVRTKSSENKTTLEIFDPIRRKSIKIRYMGD